MNRINIKEANSEEEGCKIRDESLDTAVAQIKQTPTTYEVVLLFRNTDKNVQGVGIGSPVEQLRLMARHLVGMAHPVAEELNNGEHYEPYEAPAAAIIMFLTHVFDIINKDQERDPLTSVMLQKMLQEMPDRFTEMFPELFDETRH